jgi:lysozyme family protein
MSFDTALVILIDEEGGYGVVNLGDGAGETCAGITRKNYPIWPGWTLVDLGNGDVDTLKPFVRQFYLQEFWTPLSCDKLPDPVATVLLGFAVNAGKGTAVRALQRLVGATPDGSMGPQTLAAINRRQSDFELPYDLLGEQLDHYTECSTWNQFGRGWSARVVHMLRSL